MTKLKLVPNEVPQPDIDICFVCKEHTEFNEDGESECCGAPAYSPDEYETNYER